MALYGTDFDKLMQAISSYYGSGSDQWWEVYNYYKLMGGDAATVARILKQTPYVETTVTEAGELVGYSIIEDGSVMSAAETGAAAAAQSLNSNAVTVAVKELSVPGNAVINETTGVVEMSSGATKMAGAAAGSKAATALGHVGTWVVGASIGLKLGVWLDNAIYDWNPEYWDAQNWGPVNPELWKSTKITSWMYDYSGYDDFRALVGDDGQLYIDEQTLAMAAQYLASTGAFAPAQADEMELDDESPLLHPNNYVMPISFKQNPQLTVMTANQQGYIYFEVIEGSAYGTTLTTSHTQGTTANVYYWSDSEFKVRRKIGSREVIYTAEPVTHNGITFYTILSPMAGPINLYEVYGIFTTSYNDCGWDLAYIQHYGEVIHHPGLPGFHPYAPTPQGITPDMTGDQIINLLKQQYPEIWNPTNPDDPSPLKQGVLQDNGTITDHVYIPIPTPDGGTDRQPETTPETPGKTDPQNPTSTERIVKIVQPTPNPVDQPDPDTGEGNTPTAPAPTGSANALYKIYNPTNAQIQQFGAWLWSSNFVDQLLKVFNDPMQAIISLHKIYASPHIGGTATIKVGYLDSQVPSNWVDQQYIDVDCGSVNVFETSGNVIDYMSDIRIYLPFIGIVSLDVNDVMRGVVGVKYRIDVITGTCVAFVSITRDAGAGGVIYQYTGSMAEVYPLSSGSYMGIITGVLGIAAGIAGTIASGGAAAPALIGGAAGLTAMHTKVEHSNGFSGNAGALAAKKPYIIISRPQSAMSNGIGANTGWPANYFVKLSQCSGYTRAKTLHLTGISGATDTELQEIERLLKEGVII